MVMVGSGLQGVGEVGLTFMMACAPYLFTLLAVVVGIVVYLYAPYLGVRKVPGPPATPFVGHLPLFSKYGPDVFGALAREHGPVFRFHMGRRPVIVVADPELCREVGIKNFKALKNRGIPFPLSGSPIHEEGLFLTRDSRWSQMRNTVTPLYQPAHLASLVPAMQSSVESLLQIISKHHQNNEDITLAKLSFLLATDVIGKTAFGVEFKLLKQVSEQKSTEDRNNDDDAEALALLKAHERSLEFVKMDDSSPLSTIMGMLVPVLQTPTREIFKRIPWTADYKKHQINSELGGRIDAIMAKRSADKTQDSEDFLATVLNIRDLSQTAKELFTHNYIRALAYENISGGTRTIALTLTMAIYLVSKHPDVETKLLQEIDSFGPPDVIPTADDLASKFPYLDQVIKETMRLYTAVPVIGREASQQIEIGGYVLPKGTWVWLALAVLARDPKHFPEPDVFRPERFDPACEEEKQRHPYAHIPFGLGPRGCIAQKFAMQELKLALIHIYRTYVFEQSPNMETPPQLEYGVTIGVKKDSIKLRAIKRQI